MTPIKAGGRYLRCFFRFGLAGFAFGCGCGGVDSMRRSTFSSEGLGAFFMVRVCHG